MKKKNNHRKQPGNIIYLIILFVGLVIAVINQQFCTVPLGEYDSKHWVLTGKHESASKSKYIPRIYYNKPDYIKTWSTDGKSTFCGLTDDDFQRYVNRHILGTGYVAVIYKPKRCWDGSGAECFYMAVVYYPKDEK